MKVFDFGIGSYLEAHRLSTVLRVVFSSASMVMTARTMTMTYLWVLRSPATTMLVAAHEPHIRDKSKYKRRMYEVYVLISFGSLRVSHNIPFQPQLSRRLSVQTSTLFLQVPVSQSPSFCNQKP